MLDTDSERYYPDFWSPGQCDPVQPPICDIDFREKGVRLGAELNLPREGAFLGSSLLALLLRDFLSISGGKGFSLAFEEVPQGGENSSFYLTYFVILGHCVSIKIFQGVIQI